MRVALARMLIDARRGDRRACPRFYRRGRYDELNSAIVDSSRVSAERVRSSATRLVYAREDECAIVRGARDATFPREFVHRRNSPSFATTAPSRYVTRFVTFLLRRAHPRRRPPRTFPHPIKSIVLTSKAAEMAGTITVKNSPAMRARARSLRGRRHRQDPLHIWRRESRRARCAIYLRLSMYVCLGRYRATIISAHGRERIRAYSPRRPTALIRAARRDGGTRVLRAELFIAVN